jgi:hypothetical protein
MGLRIALTFAEQVAEGEDDAEKNGQENEQAEKVPTFEHHVTASAFFRCWHLYSPPRRTPLEIF